MMRDLWQKHGARVLKFGLVGLANTVVDLGVLNLLLWLFAKGQVHPHLFPLYATVSFSVATLNSYAWNRRWTFREQTAGSNALGKFYLVTIVSFLVNVGISSLLVWWRPLPAVSPTLWANIAKLIATGVSLILNFIGYDRLVFRRNTRA